MYFSTDVFFRLVKLTPVIFCSALARWSAVLRCFVAFAWMKVTEPSPTKQEADVLAEFMFSFFFSTGF